MTISPQANYTDWSTATCQRNLVPTFVNRGVSRGQSGGSHTVVNLSFLDRSRYFSSRGWVGPMPEPLLRRKFGNAGTRTQDLSGSRQELY
jgi:hypothetical protein